MAQMRVFLLFLVLVFLLSACGDSSPTAQTLAPAAALTSTVPPTPDPKITRGTAQDEDDIKVALLLTQFDKGLDPTDPYKAYCIGTGTTMTGASTLSDPTQVLLDRFKSNTPPVVKASDCPMVDDKIIERKSILKVSGDHVRFYAVSNITWLSSNRVELEASHQGNFGDAGGQVFQLEKKDGNWQVVGTTRTWVA